MDAPVELAARVKEIKASPTLAVDAKAKALKAEGADVLNFSVGEPDFDTPAHVREAGKEAIDQGFTRYTPVPGILPLRQAVCDRMAADHGWHYQPDQIQVSCGGKHGLYNMAQALFGPGDEVLVPAPYWVSYPPIVQLAGATPVIVPLDEKSDFDLDPAVLVRYATAKTRGIILNSPSNPTGSVLSARALEAIGELALERGWVVISDDIYDTIVYGGGKLPHILDVDPRLAQRTLILNGVSKSFAMTGWRIGYTAGPKHIIAAMNKIQSQATSNPSSVAQKAALAALTGPQDFPQEMRDAFLPRLDFIIGALTAIPGVSCVRPRGAFYVFPNVSAYFGKKSGSGKVINDSVSLADYLLEEALLATVPGAAFGADQFIRFSFATSMEILEEGMQRLAKALGGLV
ncbi:MAG TPA: pyridoxal phosphate-dependent aminotransferase [Desulfurivibrio alkaliphilus]|uniref:Aminotransferase n=1 Tax=Desulfurivibrio alkaliphilus TaxID=427923 RepID=A0A7C2TFJ6_9BACT|nr:pyridoxal phosphate-dependent aminotransferase [Desulfurivibrio alkaliphilus]